MPTSHPRTVASVLVSLEKVTALPPGVRDGRRGTYAWTSHGFRFVLSGEVDRGHRERLLWQLFVRPEWDLGDALVAAGFGGSVALRAVDVPPCGLAVGEVGDFAMRGASFFVDAADFCRVSCLVTDVERGGIATRLSPGLGARTVIAFALARRLGDAALAAEIRDFLHSDARVTLGPDASEDLLTNAHRWARTFSRAGIAIDMP